MSSVKPAALAGTLVAAAIALMAAQQPSPLAQAQAGLWEISGVPGAKTPVKQCVASIPVLAEFEHRGKSCSAKVVKDGPSWTVIEYNCGGDGFGRSKIDVITPRSLRIETQGISQQLPFGYVLQAHRVGDCPGPAAPARH